MIEAAIAALRRGDIILLYDFDEREGETDFAIRSDAVTPRHILQMRKDGGGLICTAVHPESARRLGLPFEQVMRSLNGGGQDFCREFRSPGHVPLLRAAEKLLDQRRGQTELSIALAEMAGITPAVTICEMLDDQTGNALSKEDAIAYAERHGLVFIEGKEIMERWIRERHHETA
jgi:3,4-dihydroxy 2-butanone 4-phosphate synthase